ncbi:MAG: hypothetical protein AB7N29_20130 [Vicinamibacterales bacterium]
MFAALCAPSLSAAAVVDVARAFTPRFEQVGPLVLLDAGGLSRLFGTAQELGEHLQAALESRQGVPSRQEVSPRQDMPSRQQPQPRVAIAFTQTAAALLALGRPGLTVVEPGQEEKSLAPLSISVLDRYEHLRTSAPSHLSTPAPQHPSTSGWHHPRHTHQASRPKPRQQHDRQLETLTKWGIRTLGAFAAIAGPEVFERLGDRGLQWQALARGVDARPLVPWVDDVPFEAALELEWPIEGLEPLSFVLARLFEPLSERLEQADRGAAVICTSLRLTTRRVHSRTLQLPSPMRDAKTLRTLVLLDLETHPPDAPIDTVRVFIEPTPGRVLQWTLLERAQPAPEQVSTLIARLSALMGEKHVGSPVLVDTWRPGDFAMGDFRSSIDDQSSIAHGQPEVDRQSSVANLPCALRRFRFPIPARVHVQEGRPIRIVTDRNGFTSGAVVQAAGPWRTSGEWWSASAGHESGELRRAPRDVAAFGHEGGWDRDEWDVAMADGTIYRLVVERGVGQWFLEGIVD